MKSVILCAVLGVTLVWGDVSVRQTDPKGHVPDTKNPTYILDQVTEVVAIVTSSGCYLYHLSDEELISAGDPGGLDNMEKALMKVLTTTTHFPVAAQWQFTHLSSSIKNACKQPKTYNIRGNILEITTKM